MEGHTSVKNDKGNYRGYYKMRPDSNVRLSYLNSGWFQGMTCLDVGCNDGQFCIALAESFSPKYILGIDPDFVLIDSAQSRLKRLLYNKRADANVEKVQPTKPAEAPKTPARFGGFLPRNLAVKAAVKKASIAQQSIGAFSTGPVLAQPTPAVETGGDEGFPNNIKFKAKDVFDVSTVISPSVEGKYDTVTCFSVTKWIHLNGGDAKLLELFCKFYSLVRKGGRVIIEYQPWKSYENNKTASETIKKVFPTILIRPEHFEWILTEIVGFEIDRRLGTPISESKGFDRPILVLRRPVVAMGTRVWDNHADFNAVCKCAYDRLSNEVAHRMGSAAARDVAAGSMEVAEGTSKQEAVVQSEDSQSNEKKRKHSRHPNDYAKHAKYSY